MRALTLEMGVISWDICTHPFLFPFRLPFLLSLMTLTYTFHRMQYFIFPFTPVYRSAHIYSLAWHPSILQLKYSFLLVNRWVPPLYPFLFTTSNIHSFSLVNSHP